MNLAYWLCQILGWGSYIAIAVFFATRDAGPRPDIFVGFGLFWIYAIGLTHLLRREIRRRAWLSLPFRKSIPRLFAATLLTAAVIWALVMLVNLAFTRELWNPTAMAAVAGGVTWVTLGWTVIYVGISSTRAALRNQLAARQAELKALENQVNPHFLFNCLNTIRGMIVENPSQAQDMVTRLANILRYNLRQDRAPMAPLSEEMEIVADYLSLESQRFEDRLRVKLAIDPAAARTLVPCMLVQTLVENALKHGLSQLSEGGDLEIRASLDSGALALRVENSGSLTDPKETGTRIGLKNARDCLRLLYGDRATLQLENQNRRVIATLRIPVAA
jgi:two-component sensor histidine kinase